MYHFLITLPVDPSILGAIEDPSTPYLELFPPREPLKALYVARALRRHLALERQRSSPAQLQQYLDDPETNDCAVATAMGRVLALVISVISDRAVMMGANQECHMELSCALLDLFLDLINGKPEEPSPHCPEPALLTPVCRPLLSRIGSTASRCISPGYFGWALGNSARGVRPPQSCVQARRGVPAKHPHDLFHEPRVHGGIPHKQQFSSSSRHVPRLRRARSNQTDRRANHPREGTWRDRRVNFYAPALFWEQI